MEAASLFSWLAKLKSLVIMAELSGDKNAVFYAGVVAMLALQKAGLDILCTALVRWYMREVVTVAALSAMPGPGRRPCSRDSRGRSSAGSDAGSMAGRKRASGSGKRKIMYKEDGREGDGWRKIDLSPLA